MTCMHMLYAESDVAWALSSTRVSCDIAVDAPCEKSSIRGVTVNTFAFSTSSNERKPTVLLFAIP